LCRRKRLERMQESYAHLLEQCNGNTAQGKELLSRLKKAQEMRRSTST